MNHRWSKLGHNVHYNWFQIWTRQCHLKAKRKYMSAVLWRKLDQGCLATAFEVLWGGVFSDILSKHWRGDGGLKSINLNIWTIFRSKQAVSPITHHIYCVQQSIKKNAVPSLYKAILSNLFSFLCALLTFLGWSERSKLCILLTAAAIALLAIHSRYTDGGNISPCIFSYMFENIFGNIFENMFGNIFENLFGDIFYYIHCTPSVTSRKTYK